LLLLFSSMWGKKKFAWFGWFLRHH